MRIKTFLILVAVSLSGCVDSTSFFGTWSVDQTESTDIEPWRGIEYTFTDADGQIFLKRHFDAGKYSREDSLMVTPDGSAYPISLEASAHWLDQPHIGVFQEGGTAQEVSLEWQDPGKVLVVRRKVPLATAQGTVDAEIVETFTLAGDKMQVEIKRAARPSTIRYTMVRPG